MRKLSFVLVAAALSSSLTGCYRHYFVNGSVTQASVPAYKEWHHHLFWGLANLSGEVDLTTVCPGAIARIQNKISIVDGILSSLTGGIYTPTEVRIYCAVAGAEAPQPVDVSLEITPALAQELVNSDPEVAAFVATELANRE